MKKIVVVIALLCAVFTAASAEPIAGRMWENLNFTILCSPDLAFTVMPGHRWEFSNNTTSTADTYFEELFVGPTWTFKLSDSLKIKLPIWYYYMGFPTKSSGAYPFSHNLEILPIVEYKFAPALMLSSRSIFHNTFFASINGSGSTGGFGFSTLLREMVLVNYSIDASCTFFAGDELFVGLLTDANYAGVYGPGFSPSGIDENRIIAGFTYKISPELSITPQYIYSTTYLASAGVGNAANGTPKLSAHNFYLTVTYLFKAF